MCRSHAPHVPDHYPDPEKGRQTTENPENRKPEGCVFPKSESGQEPCTVRFDEPNDPANPMQWPWQRKWAITAILASMTFVTTFTSAIFSTAVRATAEEFDASTEVMNLGTSLFLLGFTCGPMLWGPSSEYYVSTVLHVR